MNIKEYLFTLFTILIYSTSATAGPVRTPEATFTQPDGSRFEARVYGDEWHKIRTTADGCAIIKGEDGWWYYGIYDFQGCISPSGVKVGQNAPQSVIVQSRQIPHAAIANRVREKRAKVSQQNNQRLKQIRSLTAPTKAATVPKEVRGLAILVQFKDTKFTFSKADFEAMLNSKGYNGTGSAKDYFTAQFGEDWEFTFDVSDIVTLDNPVKYYGENDKDGDDKRVAELIRDACRKADQSVDFSKYDLDSDGVVDNVYVFYAGEDEAANTEQTDLVWAHQWYVLSGGGIDIQCDGKQIDRYACSSELDSKTSMAEIGTFCHEFSHTFGLMDMYDTDYESEGLWSAGLWRTTSLMDGGNYNNGGKTPPYYNCIERDVLGLSYPILVEKGKTYTLEPVHKNGMYCRLDTDTEGEYYLLECRSNEGWDKYIGGKGLLIYHIDRSGGSIIKWELSNSINADSTHPCADLIEADCRPDAFTSNSEYYQAIRDIKNIFFPLDNASAMIPKTHPSFKFWSGSHPPLCITGIRRDGENISFTVTDMSDINEAAHVQDVNLYRFPDAITVTFRASKNIPGSKAILEWKQEDENEFTNKVEVTAYSEGFYSYKITGLKSGNTQYNIAIHFENGETIGDKFRQSALTKRMPPIIWPYINFSDISSTMKAGEIVPLHVTNASNAFSIEWSLDGTPIETAESGIFTASKSGTLRADVIWKNGSCDTIIKQIEVTK